MGRVCAAAGCTGGSKPSQAERQLRGVRQLTLFKVPKCKETRQQWAESLGVVFDNNDFICEMHFCDEDVLRADVVNIGSTTHILPRHRYDLRKGAIPEQQDRVEINDIIIPEEPSTSCEDAGVIEDNVESIQVDVEETEILNHDQLEIPHTLTPTTLKSYLSEKPLPKTWSWAPSPGSEDEIVLFQVDPLSFELRIRMHVYKDLSVTIRTSDRLGELKMDDVIMTIPEFEELIEVVGAAKLCSGSGISTQSRSKNCSVIADGSYQRIKVPRCVHCKKVRNLCLNNIRRQSSDLKSRYARSRQKAHVHIRRYQHLVKKLFDRGRLQFPSQQLFQLTKVLEMSILDGVGEMGVNLQTLNSILDAVSAMVGCEAHLKETTRKIIDFYLIMRGHFLSKSFNSNSNNNQEKSRMHRKPAKL